MAKTESLVGRVIDGRYRVERLLGEGGMGSVFEVEQLGTRRKVALKLMAPWAAHPDVEARFRREAIAAGALADPNIAQVFDGGTDPELRAPYIAMELLKGYDVEQLISRLGPLAPDVALRIAAQACSGLIHAHARGVVHRDIKPANLFLAHSGEGRVVVKLLDFGIAKVKMDRLGADGVGLTQTGSMLGTPLYMSPEQAEGARDIDARTDLWSLGAVLFQLLSGRPPFETDTLGKLIVAITTTRPDSVQERAPWVVPEVAALVDKALARDRSARYATAKELLGDLQKLLPNGSDLTEAQLLPLDDSFRQTIARRVIRDRNVSPAQVELAGVASTQAWDATTLPRAKRRRRSWVWVTAGVSVVGAFGLAWIVGSSPPREVSSTSGSAAIAPSVPSPGPGAAAPVKTVMVAIPEGASVRIDGVPAERDPNGVLLTGEIGSRYEVEVRMSGREPQRETIVITRDGAFPSRIDVGPTSAVGSSSALAPAGGPPPLPVSKVSPPPATGPAPSSAPSPAPSSAPPVAPPSAGPAPTKEFEL